MLSSALTRAVSVNLRALSRVLQQDLMALEPAIRLQPRFGEGLRWRSASGVNLRLNRDGALDVRIEVIVRRDTDLRGAATTVQDLVRETLDRISDAPVAGIHVCIAERR